MTRGSFLMATSFYTYDGAPLGFMYNVVNNPLTRGTRGGRFITSLYQDCKPNENPQISKTNYSDSKHLQDQYYTGIQYSRESIGEDCGDNPGVHLTSDWRCVKPAWPMCTNNNWLGGNRYNACNAGFEYNELNNYPNTNIDEALITDNGTYTLEGKSGKSSTPPLSFAKIDDYDEQISNGNMKSKPGWAGKNGESSSGVGVNLSQKENKAKDGNRQYGYIPESNFRCVFDPTKFTTVDQVENYVQRWGKYYTPESKYTFFQGGDNDAPANYDTLMKHFCSLPQNPNSKTEDGTSICPTDPYTGKPMVPFCSTFLSKTPSGDLCREWVNSKITGTNPVPWKDKNVSDSYNRYCNHYKGVGKYDGQPGPDCGCILRSNNAAYNALKKESEISGGTISDGCWWLPCQDPAHYLIADKIYGGVEEASGVTNSEGAVGLTCASDLCKSMELFIDEGTVDYSDNTRNITCVGETTDGPNDGGGNNLTKEQIVVITIGVVSLVLFVIIVVFFMT